MFEPKIGQPVILEFRQAEHHLPKWEPYIIHGTVTDIKRKYIYVEATGLFRFHRDTFQYAEDYSRAEVRLFPDEATLAITREKERKVSAIKRYFSRYNWQEDEEMTPETVDKLYQVLSDAGVKLKTE